jgi:hypothetical protein
VSGVGAHLARASVAFTDPHNARLLWLAAGGLFVLGALLTIGTIVWWRRARSEHPALASLESMRRARRPARSAMIAAPGADVPAAVLDPEHPSGPVDLALDDDDVTAIGEHPAAATDRPGETGDVAGIEPSAGIDPLLRPVDASD